MASCPLGVSAAPLEPLGLVIKRASSWQRGGSGRERFMTFNNGVDRFSYPETKF